jgi:hypothetical protein
MSTSNTPPANNPHDHARILSRHELLELASLDALGLLDEDERRQFEASFAAATPAIRAQVRAQQSLEAGHQISALPEGAPAPSLRQRVIDRVLAELRTERAGAPVIARIDERGVHAAELVGTTGRARGVNPLWRAAAIGCMAAAVLFGVVSIQLWGQFDRLDNAIRTNTVAEVFAREFGPRFETALLNPKTQFVQFDVAQGAPGEPAVAQTAAGVMLVDASASAGQFFARDLPANQHFALVVVTPGAAGTAERRVIATFTSTDTRAVHQLANFTLPAGATIEVQSLLTARPVLRSMNI